MENKELVREALEARKVLLPIFQLLRWSSAAGTERFSRLQYRKRGVSGDKLCGADGDV